MCWINFQLKPGCHTGVNVTSSVYLYVNVPACHSDSSLSPGVPQCADQRYPAQQEIGLAKLHKIWWRQLPDILVFEERLQPELWPVVSFSLTLPFCFIHSRIQWQF